MGAFITQLTGGFAQDLLPQAPAQRRDLGILSQNVGTPAQQFGTFGFGALQPHQQRELQGSSIFTPQHFVEPKTSPQQLAFNPTLNPQIQSRGFGQFQPSGQLGIVDQGKGIAFVVPSSHFGQQTQQATQETKKEGVKAGQKQPKKDTKPKKKDNDKDKKKEEEKTPERFA